MFLSSVQSFQNYPSFEAHSFRDSISIKKFQFRSGPTVGPDWVQTACIGYQQTTKVVTSRRQVNLLTHSLLHIEQTFLAQNKVAFHQGLHYLLRYERSLGVEICHFIEILTGTKNTK